MEKLSTPMMILPMQIIGDKNNVTHTSDTPNEGCVNIVSKEENVLLENSLTIDDKNVDCFNCSIEKTPEEGYITPMEILNSFENLEKFHNGNTETDKETEAKSQNHSLSSDSIKISNIIDSLISKTDVMNTDPTLTISSTDLKTGGSKWTLCPSRIPQFTDNSIGKNNVNNPAISNNRSLQSAQSEPLCISQTASKDDSTKLNPAFLAQTLLRENRIIMYKKAVYIWDYNCYRLLSNMDLIRICNRRFNTEISNAGSYSLLKSIAQFVVSQAEDHNLTEDTSGFIVFQNGVLQLSNNSFTQIVHELSDFLVLHAIKVSYSYGQCPIFNAYLNSIAGGKKWLVKRLWQTLGLLLSSDIKAKRVVVLIGTGGSGKSTFGNIVREFFHEDNVTSFSPKALLDRFAGAALVNSAVNICMDLPSLPFDADVVARIKGLSGGDSIEGEIKYMSNFSYIYKGHLLFGSNHPIKLTYPDEAFFERLLLIPCNYKVPQNSRDPYLIEHIRPELSVIASKAALYFSEVRNNGYHFEGDNIVNNDISTLFTVETPNNTNDNNLQRFFQERCRIVDSQETYTPIRDLFSEYDLFCRQYQQVNLYSANTFSKALSNLLPNSKTIKKRIGKDTINCRTCIIIKEKEDNLT